MLVSFSFRSGAANTRAVPPRQSPPLPESVRVTKLVHVLVGSIRSISKTPDSSYSSLRALTGFLFLKRLVFSPACENPWDFKAVRRTNYQSSQTEPRLHSCTESSASRPEQACDPSQADDWQRSAVRPHPSSQVVFLLIPELVSTPKRRCPQCCVGERFIRRHRLLAAEYNSVATYP